MRARPILLAMKDSIRRLLLVAASEPRSAFGSILRILLLAHPLSRMALHYHAGNIQAASKLTDKVSRRSSASRALAERVEEIDLAMTDWAAFQRRVELPPVVESPSSFNGQVLMVVESCAFFNQNGYAKRSTQIASALAARGVTTSFCARLGYPWDLPGMASQRSADRVRSDEGLVWLRRDREGFQKGADSAYWQRYADHIEHVVRSMNQPQTVLHAHSKYPNAISSVIAGRRMGIPVVYEMRGLWHLTRAQSETQFAHSGLFKYEERMEVWAAELADAVIAVSSGLKRWLVEKGVPGDKIHVMPNAPDAVLCKKNVPARKKGGDTLKLAFMGSLAPYEGLDTVITAIQALISEGEQISLDIYGEGAERQRLERLVKRLRLDECVTLHGRVSHSAIQELIPKFDIFPIMRSDSEVTRLIPPLKHLEPMAAGKLVLISALPALLQSVPGCLADHAITPGDSKALAAKLQELHGNPEMRRELSEQSLQWVIRNRNWAENARRYIALYERIAAC